MILTRTYLNPQRGGAKKLLTSPQAMHAAVLSGFPPSQDPGRVLWRVDQDRPHQATLWIVSAHEPDLAHLEEQAGWPTKPTTVSASYDGLLGVLSEGQQWAFRLTANPTHRAQVKGRSLVVAHVTAEQQLTWLLDRAEAMGVSFQGSDGPSATVTARSTRRFRRGDAMVTLGTATFSGGLTVVDADALRRTLTSGVGRGKAYGCGLLTLARP